MKFKDIDANIYTYFRKRDGNYYYDHTKEEIYNMIAKDGKDTFIYFCEQLDIPFIEHEYKILQERYPDKNIFGRYLSKMKLVSFRPYTWKDSNDLNERYESWANK